MGAEVQCRALDGGPRLHPCSSGKRRCFASGAASGRRADRPAASGRPANALRCSAQLSSSGRRELLTSHLLPAAAALLLAGPAHAIGFQKELKKRKIPLEEYATTEDGIRVFDVAQGSGEAVAPGTTISVHFDVMYKSLDVVSTRSARLLGGNRSVAEPFEFVVGQPVSQAGAKKITDSANGLFAGQAGVKPPPALSTAVIGMRPGGKRLVNVPPEIGYGPQGFQEIPPNATVQLQVELLKILK